MPACIRARTHWRCLTLSLTMESMVGRGAALLFCSSLYCCCCCCCFAFRDFVDHISSGLLVSPLRLLLPLSAFAAVPFGRTDLTPGVVYQFERIGYFAVDTETTPEQVCPATT